MPELPEVETIRLGLQKYLVGHKILDVEIKVPAIFQGDPKNIINAKVTQARRFGKGLVVDLSNGHSLAIHVKLTGQLIYRDEKTKNIPVSKQKVGELPSKFTHVIFKLDPPASQARALRAGKNAYLYYNDIRRFGWIKVVPTNQVQDLPFFKGMGPEPFKDLTLDYFAKVLSSSSVAIKPLIMDQKRIGGIGNIYANDACYYAKIDPTRPAKSLTPKEMEMLYEGVHKSMEKSLKYGGSSELTYVNVLGQEGEYQHHTLIYGRDGDLCERDGEKIQKIFLGGRGTYFCPACQR